MVGCDPGPRRAAKLRNIINKNTPTLRLNGNDIPVRRLKPRCLGPFPLEGYKQQSKYTLSRKQDIEIHKQRYVCESNAAS